MTDSKLRQAFAEYCAERCDDGEQPLILDNHAYDGSIVGITEAGSIVYSLESMIQEFMADEGCDYDEAVEWIEYNTLRAIPYMSGAGIPPTILEETRQSLLEKYGFGE